MRNKVLYLAIDETYRLESQKDLYQRYLYIFDQFKGKTKLKRTDLSHVYLNDLMTDIFSDERYFKKLLSMLPQSVNEIMKMLVLEGMELDVENLEKKFGINMVKRDLSYSSSPLKWIEECNLIFGIKFEYNYRSRFSSKYSYTFFLPKEIRIVLKQYYATPEKYILKPLDLNDIGNVKHIYLGKDSIINDLSVYCKFLEHEQINIFPHKRILKTPLRSTREICDIVEFYNNAKGEEWEFIKTELIVRFIDSFKFKNLKLTNLQLLKSLFMNYQLGEDFYTYELLYHLSNTKKTFEYRVYNANVLNSNFNTSVFYILKNLSVSKWYNFENISNFSLYKELDLTVIKDKNADELYFSKESKYTYDSKQPINTKQLYHDAIIKPLLKGTFFLLAAFGIIDIAYDNPKNETKAQKKDYLSIFDGLKYVSLTALGAYVAGITESYTITAIKDDTDITLDENELIINVSGKSKLKTMFIKSFATQLSDNIYKMDYLSFLNECNTPEDIVNKIELFKREISKKPPKIWQDFFTEILKKSQPLAKNDELVIYKLNDDKELTELFIKDEVLRGTVLKVESFQLAINKKDLSKVRKRLENFGYLSPV